MGYIRYSDGNRGRDKTADRILFRQDSRMNGLIIIFESIQRALHGTRMSERGGKG